ncbi:F-box/RNI-like superfamily protein [Rhynchospora pubera]|uniref:F-box/RNI-like superfamily protein n=1 Tax=Rhynchospora pubera TaxID=906938 RepID=A0AAV8F8Q7_9POAL|nr:F-box/RNI-like superfamily protein [Rhynchospora pubera]
MDLFGNLPDEILAYILSFLSTKEAVQTCILAKRWKKIWASVPVLEFNFEEFWRDCSAVDNYEKQRICDRKFEKFVNNVLQIRGPSHLDVFWYCNSFGLNYSETSLKWLDHVMILKPREISLLVDGKNAFDIPDSLFSCSSLQELSLNILSTDEIHTIRTKSINLPSLKMLEIQGVDLDNNFVEKLFTGCPALESLHLSHCDLYISDISCKVLKNLAFHECYQCKKMQISCPSLESLVIDVYEQVEGISLQNMVSLVNAKLHLYMWNDDRFDMKLLSALSNVSTLKLDLRGASCFEEILKDDIADCRTFINLTSLEIANYEPCDDFYLVACFLKHSPSLQELTLRISEVRRDNLQEEPRKKKQRVVVSQREHLEVIRIINSGATYVMKLIDELRARIKTIGVIIMD